MAVYIYTPFKIERAILYTIAQLVKSLASNPDFVDANPIGKSNVKYLTSQIMTSRCNHDTADRRKKNGYQKWRPKQNGGKEGQPPSPTSPHPTTPLSPHQTSPPPPLPLHSLTPFVLNCPTLYSRRVALVCL